jgi:hypothetical protein|uniref:C2H2-type domain-containing protein n=1 Tax=viral metagenome TaxID=1070528 RepID=A0A6C0M0R9_9ZZZZ
MNETKDQYVYIMSNPSYDDDVLKIGWTRKHHIKRAMQTTGVPTYFVVEYVIVTHEGPELETRIHTHLKQYRIEANRKFFKIPKDVLREILTNELNLVLTCISDHDEAEKNEKYNCDYCPKVFGTRNGKWYHEKKCTHKPLIVEWSKKAFACAHCGKGYDARNSLWYHEQKCAKNTTRPNTISIAVIPEIHIDMESAPVKNIKKLNIPSVAASCGDDEACAAAAAAASASASPEFNMMKIVEQLMEQNKTLQTQLIELSKERNMTINNNTTNTMNQQFNLQVFLNTECKDAIKLSDFVKSLNITVEDLEFTKNNGIIEGVSSIIVNNLKGMEVHKRPIHCTDVKRETMYVKADEWIKDDNCANIKKFIYLTSCYQIKRIQDWIDAHPGWETKEKLHTEYLALCKELYKNIENDDNAHKKIIKGFIKNVQIDKHK